MIKNNIGETISNNMKRLIYNIPIEQRKRIIRNKTCREGWLGCTLFWNCNLIKRLKLKTEDIILQGCVKFNY